jgi:type VI protein secretion system component VasF
LSRRARTISTLWAALRKARRRKRRRMSTMISAAAVAAAAMTLMTWTSSALHRARPRRSDRIPHLASCGREKGAAACMVV